MKIVPLILGFLGATLVGQTLPEDKGPSIEEQLLALLNTPVSGASKREQRLMDSPQAIEVLTGDDIKRMGVLTLKDALKLMTGIDILDGDNGFAVIGMRGVMQQGQPRTVQILIDGVPLYNSFGGSVDLDNLPVTLGAVERIEVVRGPSSTLYGANAVVGVVAITTRKAGEGTHGNAMIARGDKDTSRWDAGLGLGGGHWGFTANYAGNSLGTTDRDVFAMGDTKTPYNTSKGQFPDSGHAMSGLARLDWKDDSTNLWASVGNAHKTEGAYTALQSRSFDVGTLLLGWHQTWSPFFSTEFRLHQTNQTDHFNMADSSAQSYAQALELMGRPPLDISGNYPLLDVTTRQAEFQANWDPKTDLHFVFGADTRTIKAKKEAFIGLQADDSESASGAFLAADWSFLPGWTLSMGIRAENETLGGSRTSPRATLVWAATPTSVFRAGYYTSTRSPQLAEQRANYYYVSPNPDLPGTNGPAYLAVNQVIPNTLLEPEKTTNYELGYRQSMGAVTLDATIYQMRLLNQITQTLTGAPANQTVQIPTGLPAPYPPAVPEVVPIFVNQFQNGGNATNSGIELALTWSIQKDWTAGANGRYLHFTQDETSNGPAYLNGQFSYAPQHLETLWTRFKWGRLTGYADIQQVASASTEALTSTGIVLHSQRPAYLQGDAQLSYEFVKGLSAGVYTRNAARQYTLQGASGPERPAYFESQRREFGASLRYAF